MSPAPLPSASVGFRIDAGDVERMRDRMRLWARDQLRFVEAASLTDTAKHARAFVADGMVEHFRVRNKQLRNAIQYEPADKRQNPREAKVGTREWAAFLTLQALGGYKTGRGSRVAVPTRLVKRTASGRVPARLKPRILRASPKLDEKELEDHARITVRAKRRGAPAIFYHLVARAKIEPRWPFKREVEESVRAHLPTAFRRRMQEALR